MYVKETEGVEIAVRTRFEPQFSNPMALRFVFSYHITITNKNDFAVQLLRRHWMIIDENSKLEEVEGPGVVGEQPVIGAGMSHNYSSCCDLPTIKGKMHGTYTMFDVTNESRFKVEIPEFILKVPYNLN